VLVFFSVLAVSVVVCVGGLVVCVCGSVFVFVFVCLCLFVLFINFNCFLFCQLTTVLYFFCYC